MYLMNTNYILASFYELKVEVNFVSKVYELCVILNLILWTKKNYVCKFTFLHHIS